MATRALDAQPLNYRGHIAGLDVLRGVAILSVLLHHGFDNTLNWTHWHGLAAAWVAVTGVGHLGVHLFFVLSGFLITGILLDSKRTPGTGPSHFSNNVPRGTITGGSPSSDAGASYTITSPGTAQRFYFRRARRILPAYVLLLAALWATRIVSWQFVLASVLFVVNMGRLVGASLNQFSFLWSLAVEEQFYLVWPWIVWRASLKTVGRVIAICLVLPPVFRLVLTLIGQDSYFKTWVNVDYLMYGALIAYTLRTGALHSGNLRRVARWLYAGAFAGMALSVLIWLVAGDKVWVLVLANAVGRTPEMVLFVAMLLSCLIAHQAGTAVDKELSTSTAKGSFRDVGLRGLPGRFLMFLGYISYGLYLVHMLLFRLYDRYVAGTALGSYKENFALLVLRAALCSTTAVLLAWLSRVTLEEWFLRRNLSDRGKRPGRADAGTGQPLQASLPLPPVE